MSFLLSCYTDTYHRESLLPSCKLASRHLSQTRSVSTFLPGILFLGYSVDLLPVQRNPGSLVYVLSSWGVGRVSGRDGVVGLSTLSSPTPRTTRTLSVFTVHQTPVVFNCSLSVTPLSLVPPVRHDRRLIRHLSPYQR